MDGLYGETNMVKEKPAILDLKREVGLLEEENSSKIHTYLTIRYIYYLLYYQNYLQGCTLQVITVQNDSINNFNPILVASKPSIKINMSENLF